MEDKKDCCKNCIELRNYDGYCCNHYDLASIGDIENHKCDYLKKE